jgi:hypothetical protein
MRRFFEHGSASPTGASDSVFRVSGAKASPSELPKFDRTLRNDCELLLRHSPGSVFRNAPNTWRLGHTTLADDLRTAITEAHSGATSGAVDGLLDRVIDHCNRAEIATGQMLYRLRLNLYRPFDRHEFDSAPLEHAVRSRFSDGSRQTLYCALDVDTCIHECRALAEDALALGVLKPLRNLSVLDLTDVPFDPGVGDGGNLFYFINWLVFGQRSTEARLLGSRIRARGLDGILYPSFLSRIRPKGGAYHNVALFGSPLSDGLLEVSSLNRIRLDAVKHEFTYGPLSVTPTPADVEDLMRITSDLKADEDLKRHLAQMRDLMARWDPQD